MSNRSVDMDPQTEAALVAGLRAGDTAAFNATYAAFNTRLFGFLVRLSRRRDVAEDLVEETWLRLVSHGRKLRPDTRLAAWLFTVARNLYVSHQRSRALEDSHAAGLGGLWPMGTPHVSPFEHTAVSEMERRIESALAEMSATHREVLLLVGIEQFRPSEAAAICGITQEALRQRLSRARAELDRRLEECAQPDMSRLREVTS